MEIRSSAEQQEAKTAPSHQIEKRGETGVSFTVHRQKLNQVTAGTCIIQQWNICRPIRIDGLCYLDLTREGDLDRVRYLAKDRNLHCTSFHLHHPAYVCPIRYLPASSSKSKVRVSYSHPSVRPWPARVDCTSTEYLPYELNYPIKARHRQSRLYKAANQHHGPQLPYEILHWSDDRRRPILREHTASRI